MERLSLNLREASIKTYEASCTALILWLLENNAHLIPNAYKIEVRRHKNGKETFIKSTVFQDLRVPPIKVDEFTGDDFVAWLSTLKRENGEWWSFSTYRNHRSGLYHLYLNYNVEVTKAFRLTVDGFFSTLPKQKYDTVSKILRKPTATIASVNSLKQSLSKELTKLEKYQSDNVAISSAFYDRCLDILNELSVLHIDFSVLRKTLIGTVVSKFKKCENENVSSKAKLLVKKWKSIAAQNGVTK